ncbi:DUF2255 family protein [Herbiconiux daphne]|uniref:DUF2255 family protein n=1 Tax=Herbiconiux daphne TaxID=2970914 RepID=A0ABT2H562_9MICO|nr:DUF2255 family protein [Herbiconiux daphne]MCS5735075.1 DUF2255 family protein [Herbiconiux daphne]
MTTTSSWSDVELAGIDQTDEVAVASRRVDGSLRNFVIMWAVSEHGSVYVRSAYGATNPWFVRALQTGRGVIRFGAVEREVTFELDDPADGYKIDAAYHTKYDRYGPRIVGDVVGEGVHGVTLRLIPARDH